MRSDAGVDHSQLSKRAGADACHSTLNSKIDPSNLAAKGVLRARRLCCLRRETAFSSESEAGYSEAGSYRSPFCASSSRGADPIVGGDSELAYYRADEICFKCNYTILSIV